MTEKPSRTLQMPIRAAVAPSIGGGAFPRASPKTNKPYDSGKPRSVARGPSRAAPLGRSPREGLPPAVGNTLHPQLNVAVKAARKAGQMINRAALDVESVRVAEKSANDFVTEVDQAAEAAIVQTILQAYPDHGIFAEESGKAHGNAQSDHLWIIDPLDGTRNFIHGFPVYCVSIAMQYKGVIEQAVVYDPTRNDLFTSTRGRGAYLNDRRVRCAKRLELHKAMLATGFAPEAERAMFFQMMPLLMGKVAGTRRMGSAALELAYVAAGFCDVFVGLGLQPWDVAAGSLLITEAGGLVGDFTGAGSALQAGECMAANPRLYGAMVPLMRAFHGRLLPAHPA